MQQTNPIKMSQSKKPAHGKLTFTKIKTGAKHEKSNFILHSTGFPSFVHSQCEMFRFSKCYANAWPIQYPGISPFRCSRSVIVGANTPHANSRRLRVISIHAWGFRAEVLSVQH